MKDPIKLEIKRGQHTPMVYLNGVLLNLRKQFTITVDPYTGIRVSDLAMDGHTAQVIIDQADVNLAITNEHGTVLFEKAVLKSKGRKA